MVEDGSVQAYLALSGEYLAVASSAARDGRKAAAYHNALHALELGLKAALATRLDEVPRTHNVGGIFAREFRAAVGDDVCSRVNRLVRDYDAPRYPDWQPTEGTDDDVAFIASFLKTTLPRLLEAKR